MTKHLKFWGTRGSCPVSGPEYVQFGGNTPSLELRYDDLLLIFDAGTGIRPLGTTIKEERKKINLFISHFHWDHILGFPFFEPIYRKGVEITIWAPQNGRPSRDLFDQLLAKEFFPIHLDQIQAKIDFKVIEEKKAVTMGPLVIDFHLTRHPGHTLCFKINTPKQQIGYVTDNEIDPENQHDLIAFHKGSDLFIHEAQYTQGEYEKKHGWGHSSLGKAIDMVAKIKPGKWLVTHHDPKHTDEDLHALAKMAKESKLPCPVEWIGDGYTLPLE